jgi:hypothetical protein
MEYIDRTLLEPDTEWSDYYDEFISYSQSQINSLPKANVVEREKVNKAREEINNLKEYGAKFKDGFEIHVNKADVLAILDKLIAESEG